MASEAQKTTEINKEVKKTEKKVDKISNDIKEIKETILKNPYDFVKGQATGFHVRVRDRVGTAIVAAFAFVIALVWKDVIRDIVNKIVESVGIAGDTYIYQIMIAVLTTTICVIGIMYFSKWSEKESS